MYVQEKKRGKGREKKRTCSPWGDSNSRPLVYKTSALTTELQRRLAGSSGMNEFIAYFRPFTFRTSYVFHRLTTMADLLHSAGRGSGNSSTTRLQILKPFYSGTDKGIQMQLVSCSDFLSLPVSYLQVHRARIVRTTLLELST